MPGESLRGLAAAVLLAGLSACVAPRQSDLTSAPATALPNTGADGAQTASLVVRPDTQMPREEPRRADPKTLVGLTGKQVAELLGRPGFVRRDAPAEVWQYRGADCVLDIFLYAEPLGADGGTKVHHVELRARQMAQPSPPSCFDGMLGRARKASFPGS
ncbi:MAG: hypothetical protein FJX35_10525 [Alphaproteobacteria bacterium]|nr:hypothetical protein [Alphaproteobacteria bacterium]